MVRSPDGQPARAGGQAQPLSPEAILGGVEDREKADLELLKKAERALAEIDRTQGLEDRHADVLAALRIRIDGGPRRSLEDLMQAAGDISGQRAKELDERLRSEEKASGDLDEFLKEEPKKGRSLDDLL